MHIPKECKCDYCSKLFVRRNIGHKTCSEVCRFMIKVDKTETCWIWKKSYQGRYGAHNFNKRSVAAHRASWEIFKGSIPKGLLVCHTCDNTKCVNPDHLFLGTHKDNHQDRAKKGRNADKKGQKHHLAKLKNEDVFAIFEMSKNGMNQTQISKIFNVNPSTISFVLSGRNWSHLKGETSVI